MIVWEESTKRATIQIVTSLDWRGGNPIDPNIPKWLVKIKDHFLKVEYCPTDPELTSRVLATLDVPEWELIVAAFKLKEEHNLTNLRNPEIRTIEEEFRKIVERVKRKQERLVHEQLWRKNWGANGIFTNPIILPARAQRLGLNT